MVIPALMEKLVYNKSVVGVVISVSYYQALGGRSYIIINLFKWIIWLDITIYKLTILSMDSNNLALWVINIVVLSVINLCKL